MPISQSSQLFTLIKSLTKAEKRNFKLFVKKSGKKDSLLFIKLFEILEKQKELDEQQVIYQLKLKRKNQFPNLKRHLYEQILTSIKLIRNARDSEIEVRELIDFADILYSKGHYIQSLKLLSKAETQANKAGLQLLALNTIEKKKVIVSRHITRSKYSEINNLVIDANDKIHQIKSNIELSNLNVELHAKYIRNGHVKNEQERESIISFFQMHVPKVNIDSLDFYGKINLYKSQVWYYYILLDFERCYSASSNWIACFDHEESYKLRDPDLYMRGFGYVLTSLFNIQEKAVFAKYLEKLEQFRSGNYARFNENSKILSFLYTHNGRINMHILNGSYSKAIHEIPRTLTRIKRYSRHLDDHKILVFRFKIAWLYLAQGNPKKSIDYLHLIINHQYGNLREDIQGYSRLMFLMAHYDLENYELLPYLVDNYRRFFVKMKDLNIVQKKSLQFFALASKSDKSKRKELMKQFRNELIELRKDHFSKRAFLYLEIYVWLESNVKEMTIEEFSQKNPNYLKI